jgi:polyhydroxyalkanoate synthesis regulator phasin
LIDSQEYWQDPPSAMNPDNLFDLIQKGFRVGVGATASLVEGLQNSQLYQQNLEKLRTNPTQLMDELAEKGRVTEQDARAFVDQLWENRPGNQPAGTMTVTATAIPITPDVQAELQELTQQLLSLRTELEQLRNQQSGSSS